jgi:hypothetical protein
MPAAQWLLFAALFSARALISILKPPMRSIVPARKVVDRTARGRLTLGTTRGGGAAGFVLGALWRDTRSA